MGHVCQCLVLALALMLGVYEFATHRRADVEACILSRIQMRRANHLSVSLVILKPQCIVIPSPETALFLYCLPHMMLPHIISHVVHQAWLQSVTSGQLDTHKAPIMSLHLHLRLKFAVVTL